VKAVAVWVVAVVVAVIETLINGVNMSVHVRVFVFLCACVHIFFVGFFNVSACTHGVYFRKCVYAKLIEIQCVAVTVSVCC